MNKYFGLLLLVCGTFSCVSKEKFNQHLDQPLSVEALRKDVDFTTNKLLKKHVNLEWYYPEEVIKFRLDSFKSTITQPMVPNDFAMHLMQVISSFGHGHTYVSPLDYKLTKEAKKKYKGSKNPLKLLAFKNAENRIFLDENYTKDSTLLVHSELLAIDGYSYQDFIQKNPNVRAGDGYTKVLNQNYNASYFINYVDRKLKVRDSVVLTLQQNDSVFHHVLYRELKKDKKKKDTLISKNDTIQSVKDRLKIEKSKLTKAERLKVKDSLQLKRKINKYYAFDRVKKKYNRALYFPNPQDSTTVVLDINSFTLGSHKKAYDHIFDSIQRLGTKNLILDLRENSGGYPEDINHLFAYLTTKSEPQMVIDPLLKVKSKWTLFSRFYRKPNPFLHTIFLPLIVYKSTESFFRTTKMDGAYYYNDGRKKNFLFKDKNRYEGNLYVLTSGKSYSAASLISSALYAEGKAIFVGEETGGDYNGTVAGYSEDYKLPHSKIKILIPQMVFQPNQTRELKGRGVFPHQEIPYHFSDFMQEHDPQLAWILEDIKKKKQ